MNTSNMFAAGLVGSALFITSNAALADAAPPPEAGASEQAQDAPAPEEGVPLTAEQANAMLEKKLTFQTGEVTLKDGLATLKLKEGDRFIDAEQSAFILQDIWGNPPRDPVLGMVLPANTQLLGKKSWAVVLDYEEDGYVEDDDADSIDYAELLEDMQESTRESNEARRAAGYGEVDLIGWAEPPHYDAAAKKLYWAKELSFTDPGEPADPDHTLNYDIRVLGRRGVLVVSAVAAMSDLPTVRPTMGELLGAISFNEGHRYADFNPDMDNVAAYGIGALVAGKIASKVGLFAGMGVLLLKLKKLLILAVVGIGALISKVFKRGSSEEA